MGRSYGILLPLFLTALTTSSIAQTGHQAAFARVQDLFNSNCVTCHGGDEPTAGMSLETGYSYKNLVNRISEEDPSLKRIMPNDLYNSYLYRKVLRQKAEYPFKEDGMPLDADQLSRNDLKAIADWINSFPEDLWGKPRASVDGYNGIDQPEDVRDEFLATQLINLPTTRTLGSRTAEFRILHRFAPMNTGGETLGNFFGLDAGANISINLSLSLTDDLDLLIRRTGYFKDIEVAAKYIAIRQKPGLPVSLGVYAGFDWISRKDQAGDNRFSPNLQILSSSRVNDRLSVLLVPSFAFLSNHQEVILRGDSLAYKDSRYTMGLGFGTEYRFGNNTALVAEYIARLDGYMGNSFSSDKRFNAWSVGLAHKIRLHVFEVLISNTQGVHTTQYIPGSSAINSNKLFDDGPNFHFGFNIIRQFKW